VEPLLRDEPSFQAWMDGMKIAISKLCALVGPEVASRLNFEVDSLDVLEAWLLRTFFDYQDLLLVENATAYDGAARYFGEVLRRTVGGEWTISLENKRWFNYGYPGIDRAPHSIPHYCITATIDRQQGDYLSSIVKAEQEPAQ